MVAVDKDDHPDARRGSVPEPKTTSSVVGPRRSPSSSSSYASSPSLDVSQPRRLLFSKVYDPPPSPRLDGRKGTRIATERLAEAGATVVSRASPEARHRLTRQTSTVKNAGKVVVACLDGEHHVIWGTDLAKVIGRDAKIVVLMAIFERRLTWEG